MRLGDRRRLFRGITALWLVNAIGWPFFCHGDSVYLQVDASKRLTLALNSP